MVELQYDYAKGKQKMKTTIKFFALIIATLMFIFILSSCMESPETTPSSETTPPSETTHSTEQSVARPSLNPDEAYAMLKSNGYSMAIGSSGTTYEGELRSVSGFSGSNIVLIKYFEDASYADAAYKKMKPLYKSAGYTIEKHENMVYAGKGNGIEAAVGPLTSGIQA